MAFATVPELVEAVRRGRMVVIVDDEDRENEGDLIMAASLVRPEDINFMVREARGLVCLALTRERCRQLGLQPMVVDNTSPHRTNFTVSIEAAEGVTTGISAYDRAHTIRTAVRPDARPEHLTQPGHVFPLMASPGGVLTRAGHTEAAVDLALLAGLEPAGVLVEVLDDDGRMARRPALEVFARRHGLAMGTIADLIAWRFANEKTVTRVATRPVQTELGDFTLYAYRSVLDRELHYALVRGDLGGPQPPLVRVHLRDPLTDVLHLVGEGHGLSVHRALAAIAAEGRGVVVVLNVPESPEALRARLAGEPLPADAERASSDWRRHGLGAQILADLGLTRIRVLGTPRRFAGLSGFGIEVIEYVAPRA